MTGYQLSLNKSTVRTSKKCPYKHTLNYFLYQLGQKRNIIHVFKPDGHSHVGALIPFDHRIQATLGLLVLRWLTPYPSTAVTVAELPPGRHWPTEEPPSRDIPVCVM